MTRQGSATDSLPDVTPAAPTLRRRWLAASCLVVGLGGFSFGGLALALEPSASAAARTVATVRPLDDPSASPAPVASSAAPIVPIVPAPTTAAAAPQPTTAPPEVTSAPTQATVTAAPTSRATSTATSRSTAVPTRSGSHLATPTAKATSTSHYVPPVTSYSGTNETQPYYGGNATNDLPSGVGATGAPAVIETVKPGSSADPVYAEAATGVTTKRRYVSVQGVSVNEVLGYGALAGLLVGVCGGAGLWFTRGAR